MKTYNCWNQNVLQVMFIYFSLLSDSLGNFYSCHYIRQVFCFIVYDSLHFVVSYLYFVIIFVNTVYNIDRMSHMNEQKKCLISTRTSYIYIIMCVQQKLWQSGKYFQTMCQNNVTYINTHLPLSMVKVSRMLPCYVQ